MNSMGIAVVDGPSARHKAAGIVRAYPSIWHGDVVDVGCRSRDLEAALTGRGVRYHGVDIDPSAEIVADLGRGLPFRDGSAGVLTALDVLEHVDDIHNAFAELCRVAAGHIVITLPNCYEVRTRLRILRGRPIGAKYGMPATPPGDRHRWFFSLNDARRFVHHHASRRGWRVADERALIGPGRARAAAAVRRWPNLLCPTYLVLLTPARSLRRAGACASAK